MSLFQSVIYCVVNHWELSKFQLGIVKLSFGIIEIVIARMPKLSLGIVKIIRNCQIFIKHF